MKRITNLLLFCKKIKLLPEHFMQMKENSNTSNSLRCPVLSDIPQGTLLGPLFLLYINDITKGIDSELRLFADDLCLLP